MRLLGIRLQTIQFSPCRAGPSTRRSIRLDTTVDFLPCSCSLILSEPGEASDPETSFQVPPDYIGNTTERLVAQRPISARFEPTFHLRGFHHWFLHSYAVPPRLPDPGRLAVPTRPVVVRAAPTLPCIPQGQAALSFTRAAATARRWVLSPHPAHGASWRTDSSSNTITAPRRFALFSASATAASPTAR